MYAGLRRCYQVLDTRVVAKLPRELQLLVRGGALRVGRWLFPHRIIAVHASQVMPGPGQASAWNAPALPEWVSVEMKELASIDADLHPQGELMRSLEHYAIPCEYDEPGRMYAELRRKVIGPVDVVLLVPWLKTGGADLGALHFANALAGNLQQRVLVISTEAAESPWAERLQPQVQFISLGQTVKSLPNHPGNNHQLTVLVRLLLQLAPRVIHVMNSRLGWEAIRCHGLALRHASKLYASLYCDDVSAAGQLVGYARSYLTSCYSTLDAVVTDNTAAYRAWVAEMGVPARLFHVVPFPAPVESGAASTGVPGKRLLWAGRMDRQKRPDLLVRIAQALPEFHIDVYGSSVWDGDTRSPRELLDLSNVSYHGPYDDFSALVRPEHLAFVYTTAWDGMPNILLEAAAAGLPVIAPQIGGIADFLPTGHLIRNPEDVEGYCEAIRALAERPHLRASRIEQQNERLQHGRTWADFVDQVSTLPDYVACQTEPGQKTEAAVAAPH